MVYVALLRAVNVGGTGVLPMKDLIAICGELGFRHARTYIQSGNVVFEADGGEDTVRMALEEVLRVRMGKPVDVMVRTAAEMRAVLEGDPFAAMEGNRVAVVFLAGEPPVDMLCGLTGPGGERVQAGVREVYVYYPEGMGRSKLKLPLEGAVTVRNRNTVAKLVAMAKG